MSSSPSSSPWRASRAAVALLVLAATAACRAQSIQPLQLSESAVVLEVPLVHQDGANGCGVASLATLCRYWAVELPPDQHDALARVAAERGGLSGGEMRAALEQLGLEAFLFHGTLDRSVTGIYAHVDAGRPPLVMVAPREEDQHYLLVMGYDEERGKLVLLDPARGEVLVPVATFERDWERCERFTLLACP